MWFPIISGFLHHGSKRQWQCITITYFPVIFHHYQLNLWSTVALLSLCLEQILFSCNYHIQKYLLFTVKISFISFGIVIDKPPCCHTQESAVVLLHEGRLHILQWIIPAKFRGDVLVWTPGCILQRYVWRKYLALSTGYILATEFHYTEVISN